MIPAARAALEAVGGATVLLTNARGDEARCTRDALTQGATAIVALGGDGTISQVACELVRARSQVPLAIFGAGTGNDFAKSLGAPIHDFRDTANLIATGRTRMVDAGRVDDTEFVNSAGFGFDAQVVARTSNPGRLRGKIVYISAALEELFRYTGFKARVTAGDRVVDAHWLTMIFANGSWFGGSFRIAPEASISDGLLDSVFIGNASPMRRAALFSQAARGAHVSQPEVSVGQGVRWTLEFSSAPVYQADGELRQAASATVVVEALPGVLRVFADTTGSPGAPQI